jgi:hypothetical protein
MIRNINNLIYDKPQQESIKKPVGAKTYRGEIINYNREILYKKQFVYITENNISSNPCNLQFYDYYLSLLDLIETRKYSNMPMYTYENILYNIEIDEQEIIRRDSKVVFEKIEEKYCGGHQHHGDYIYRAVLQRVR